MRRIPALLTAALVITTLAACSPAADPGASGQPVSGPDGCELRLQPGDASSTVVADGSIGSEPTGEFPTPLIADGVERSVVERGDGDVVQAGDLADIAITAYNGADGEQLAAQGYGADEDLFRDAGADDAIARAILCSEVGSRVALVSRSDAALAPGAFAQAGVADDDTVVLLIDVLESYPAKAEGANQLPESGLPSVVTAPNGHPGITVPDSPAPEKLRVAAIKAGDGAKVGEGDELIVKYTGWLWEDEPTIFDSSWDRGTAAAFELTGAENGGGGLIPGFIKGLDGQRVGSQMLIVIPPGEDGYPEGQQPQTIPAGSTLIFVVDILGVR